MSRTQPVAANKAAGEDVERAVASAVPQLGLVPDDVALAYDAVATSAVFPGADLPMVGLCVVERGTPVEIKSCQRRYSQRQRGRYYLRPEQHGALVETGGVYVFAVRDQSDDLLALKVVPAVTVGDLIPSWLDGGDGRSDYAQLAWSRLFRPAAVDGGASP
ncbi:hypothetical protein [Haloplanus halophilus]|uniref:hypothetical protein n=1 Tax=Haloplanus halophilus TaxID=2949993 RepID=UPI00203DC65C|nr:hypothetical protein [Haloplanus sp. GDY1]